MPSLVCSFVQNFICQIDSQACSSLVFSAVFSYINIPQVMCLLPFWFIYRLFAAYQEHSCICFLMNTSKIFSSIKSGICMPSTFLNNTRLFPQISESVHTLWLIVLIAPHSLQPLRQLDLQVLANVVGMNWYLVVDLVLFSFVSKKIKFLSICFWLYVSGLVKCSFCMPFLLLSC